MASIYYQTKIFIKEIVNQFFLNSAPSRAAALTYTSLLSIVPLMAVMIGVLSFFPQVKQFASHVESYLFTHFVFSSSRLVKVYLQRFVRQVPQLSMTGLFFLVIIAWLMIVNLEKALNHIWRVKRARRSWWALILYGFVLMVAPLFISLSVGLSSYVFSVNFISKHLSIVGIKKMLFDGVSFLFSFIGFWIVYVILPNCYVPIKYASLGALFSAIAFKLSKRIFVWYTTYFPTYHLLYGAFAAIPLLLIWFYVVWIIFLMGAQLSYSLTMGHTHRSRTLLDGFSHAMLWLKKVYLHQSRTGKGCRLDELVAGDKVAYATSPEWMLTILLRHNILVKSKHRRFVIHQELENINLYLFMQRLPWRLPNTKRLNQGHHLFSDIFVEQLTQVEAYTQTMFNVPLKEFIELNVLV